MKVVQFSLTLCLFSLLTPKLTAQNHLVLSDQGKEWTYFSKLDNIFYRTIADGVFHELEARREQIQGIQTKAAVEERIKVIKGRFAKLVGPFPEKTPLNPVVTGTIKGDFYIVEKVIFESRPGFYVTGSVFKPRFPSKQQLPAVLYLSGHAKVAFRSSTYQKVILNLVKKGFLVMAIDPIGQGERNEVLERAMPFDYERMVLQHSYIGSQCLLAGDSFIKHMVWDGIRAIDYLATRNDVDMENIGATGRSGGGTQTAWLGIFEERLKATAIENYITTFRRLIQSLGMQDAEQNINYGAANGLDFADLVLARAPKPTMIITTESDFFNIEGAKETIREARHLYGLLGVEQEVSWCTDIAGHTSTPKNRESLYQFFLQHLSTPQDGKDIEIPPIPREDLVVLDEAHKSKMFERTVFDINKEAYLQAKSQLPERNQKLDSIYLKAVLGIEWNQGKPVKVAEVQFERYAVEKFFFECQDYPLPFVIIKPRQNSKHKVLVYYSPKGKEALYDEELLDKVVNGYTIVFVDLLGIGELGQGNYGNGSSAALLNPDGIPPNIWFMANQAKRSILGIWIADMKIVQDYISSRFANFERYIWATDYLSIPALHLSKFTDDFRALGVYNLLYSWESIITNKFYDPKWLMTSMPGISFQYDLPLLLSNSDERAVRIYNLVSPTTEKLNVEQLEASPDYLYYSKAHVKEAPIGEWASLSEFLAR